MKKAVISGTFDPITLGHIDIIMRATELFDKVFVAVLNNSDKTCMFDLDTRFKMASIACSDIKNVTVELHGGLLADYTEKNGIDFIVRGIRSADDTEYELMLSRAYQGYGNSPKTVFFPCDKNLTEVTSTAVRSLISQHKSTEGMLPSSVIKFLKDKKYM